MVRTTKDIILRIKSHGERTYPEECCGIMLGVSDEDNQMVEEIVELDNEQDGNRRRRFFVTPNQYLQAERTAAEKNLQLLGFYHSHPDHPAAPSEFDREHALPWFTYVIVAVSKGKANDVTTWLLSESREQFDQDELLIEETVTK